MPTQPPPPQRKLPLVLGLMSAYFAGWVRSPPAALPLPGFLASFVGAHRIGLGAAIKALPVALIATDVAAVAGPRSGPARDDYAPSVAAGLVLGSLGDVFLDLSSTNPKLFTAGLVSFLLSHLVYIRGFASLGSTTNWTAAGSVYGLTYGILYRFVLVSSTRYISPFLL